MPSLSRRTDAQTAKRAAVEQSVLAATERLLAAGATFADLSVERIATEAGISRTAFYFYFRDKRELLTRLTSDLAEQLYAQAEAWWAAQAPSEATLREAMASVVRLYREHAVLLRAVVEAATYDEPVAEFWRGLVRRFIDATRDRIAAEQQAGRAPAGLDPGMAAFSLVWMAERACYEHVVREEAHGDAELVDALVAIWLRAVYGQVA